MASRTKGGDLPRIPDQPSIVNCWSVDEKPRTNVVNGRKTGRFKSCCGLNLVRSPDYGCGAFTFFLVLGPSIVHIIFA